MFPHLLVKMPKRVLISPTRVMCPPVKAGYFMFSTFSRSVCLAIWAPWFHKRKEILFLPFGSVTQLCLTLCDLMDCSTPGLPVLTFSQSLFKVVFESVMPSNHLILCRPLLLLPSGSFLMSQLFTSGGQSIGASASASILPMNIQE